MDTVGGQVSDPNHVVSGDEGSSQWLDRKACNGSCGCLAGVGRG